ncbi:MAG: HAD-IC family P-type ATPase, partial [Roseiflexaceae bacterium]|nr:HAD-IC family P-type ATPase [Roseiflexaceae bacterium]
PLGLIALADTLRPEAAATVRELHAAGIRVALLSGDSRRVVAALAASLGIDEVHAELLPEQKVEVIRQLQAKHGPLAMIGDGVNDAPALATAALGVAMGVAGSDVALESADVLLMGDALDRLPRALAHARRARRVVRQNLVFSFGVIAVLIVCTLLGEVPLPLGVIGHEGSTLLVAANGLRLLRGWRS